ncbi:MAG: alpha/beta hydrolase, partial [Candidatus Latescibacterota bacterium]|nr:alpha/beta hydrolase [Candidatus Latescibacterota bacterium]
MVLPEKKLPISGELFEIEGCPAFLIRATAKPEGRNPWVWYAPTLPAYPSQSEKWMFDRFLEAGIFIAGIDVGESYGSPDGRSRYSVLYAHLTNQLGMDRRAALLARSRGGLMLYNWAVENADKVACVA